MSAPRTKKMTGAYFTPEAVVASLLQWAIHKRADRFLDPSCGDGRFIAGHRNSVGIEQDASSAAIAMERAPWALVHEGDFFAWAEATQERFTAAGGNPPFIRYQTFNGEVRQRALSLCSRRGANFSGLASSWAPFVVASAGLLNRGGRLAFVVPAEIGHAPYASPLLEYLVAHFELVHVVAYREKLFHDLSEDCWLLYADGFGGRTDEIRFTARHSFKATPHPPTGFVRVSVSDWRDVWKCRLRPFLLSASCRDMYAEAVQDEQTRRLGHFAHVGIGYVTGNNAFFHLRPSEAKRWGIPARFLRPTVRKGEVLPSKRLTAATVERWARSDDEMLLLNIQKEAEIPTAVRRYLNSENGQAARKAYKCRSRSPWYSVPDVQTPDFFLSYMSGLEPILVRNDAQCTCTNSVHVVRLKEQQGRHSLDAMWQSDFIKLSCELEGHPLGGGMLKLEPGEASQIAIPSRTILKRLPSDMLAEAIAVMRGWRHYGQGQSDRQKTMSVD
jgi:adenine-specific DNA-methyltransferase